MATTYKLPLSKVCAACFQALESGCGCGIDHYAPGGDGWAPAAMGPADRLRADTRRWRTHARGEREHRPERDAAILAAIEAGMPHREIARIVGGEEPVLLTYGRVGQIAAAALGITPSS